MRISKGIILWVLLAFSMSACAEKAKKPNIVFVLVDDQGYGDMSCHGNPYIKTPNIDKIHAESIRFTNYHCGSTCSPTRAGLMTGRSNNRVGVWSTTGPTHFMRIGETTIAEELVKNGYSTALFGKWHLGNTYPYRPQDRGFQEVIMVGGGGVSQQPDYWNNTLFNDTYFHNGKSEKFKGYCTDIWFDEAIKFMKKKQAKQQPFFCYIPLNACHAPRAVADKYMDMLPKDKKIPAKTFYGMVLNIDENMAKLEKALVGMGIQDDTILIFSTDNGSAVGKGKSVYNAGLRGGKGSEYEGGHRVPFFIRWKNGKIHGGRDINTLVSYNDVMPTLLDLTKSKETGIDFHGKSILPLIKGEPWEERTLVIDCQGTSLKKKHRFSAIRGKWRLVNDKELYDIEEDRSQKNNVFNQHPEIVKQLRADYETWWEKVSVGEDLKNKILIGHQDSNPVTLYSHDAIVTSNDRCPYNQLMIREAKPYIGYWNVDIVASGKYKFTIRRWPKASGLALGASTPEIERINSGTLPFGKPITFESAKIKVGDTILKTDNIDNTQNGIIFEMELEEGNTQVETWLTDNEGKTRSAYYVEVEKL